MSISWETQLRRDEEIVKTTLQAMILRAGILLGWLLLIVGICMTVLFLR